MKYSVIVSLKTDPQQYLRLCELRKAFAQVCNCLTPEVQASRIWSRVTLHHLYYHSMRKRFPHLGSQMVCNAIYAVSKIAKLVYQHPQSPYNIGRRSDGMLPLLHFAETCPVYFDRHTLSIKADELSLFTMDGRMHFQLALSQLQRLIFESSKLREIALEERKNKRFELSFHLESEPPNAGLPTPHLRGVDPLIPPYVSIESAK
jgi:hypothetical protein